MEWLTSGIQVWHLLVVVGVILALWLFDEWRYPYPGDEEEDNSSWEDEYMTRGEHEREVKHIYAYVQRMAKPSWLRWLDSKFSE